MLDLDSPRWTKLWHCRGSASDIPGILRQLSSVPSDERFADLLNHLMDAVSRQCNSTPAAIAASPHLVRMCEAAPLARRVQLVQCVARIEIARQRAIAKGVTDLELPDDLEAAYLAGVNRLQGLITSCLDEPWDRQTALTLTGALLVAKGHASAGHEIMGAADTGVASVEEMLTVQPNEGPREPRDVAFTRHLLSFVTDKSGQYVAIHVDLRGVTLLIDALENLREGLKEDDCPHTHLFASELGELTMTKLAGQESEANNVWQVKIYGWNEEWAVRHQLKQSQAEREAEFR